MSVSPGAPSRLTLAERLARLEEAVRQLERTVGNHLAHLQDMVGGHELRLRTLESERNHWQGERQAWREMWGLLRWGVSLLLPALTGSLAALVLSRLW